MHAYGKWRGAFWRLASLVDLGAAPERPGVLEAAEQALAWLASPARLKRIHRRRIEGRVRRCASQDGLGLYLCLRLGLRGDARLDTLAASRMLELHHPPYWHYDVLVGLRTLLRAGALGDARTGDALDLLESKRRPDGTWRVEGRWWKRPGAKGSNGEAVDWGRDGERPAH